MPNLRPLHHESTKHIQDVKRAERSIYREGSVMPARTMAFMADGFKELKCEPKKLGANKRTQAQRFDLQKNHINLKAAGQNNADGIRSLMTELEKQFMEDPEFQLPEEAPAPVNTGGALATGTIGASETAGTGKFGGQTLRGSPTRGTGPNADKGKKAPATNAKTKDGQEEVELEQTAESLEYAAFRN